MQRSIQIFLLGIAVFFILYGVMRKEHFTVLEKAVQICLEWIGIG